jgi:hypothetical protein
MDARKSHGDAGPMSRRVLDSFEVQLKHQQWLYRTYGSKLVDGMLACNR